MSVPEFLSIVAHIIATPPLLTAPMLLVDSSAPVDLEWMIWVVQVR